MVKLRLWGHKNNVWLFEGRIPSMETLRRAHPRSPWFYENTKFNFKSPDEATAWLLSAYARRLMWDQEHKYGTADPDVAVSVPLETWVVGFPKVEDAALARWFQDQPSAYRVLIHRQEKSEDCNDDLWEEVYLRHRKRLPIIHRRKYGDLKRTTEPFLEQLLYAYEQGRERSFMERSNHPFHFSAGLASLEVDCFY